MINIINIWNFQKFVDSDFVKILCWYCTCAYSCE